MIAPDMATMLVFLFTDAAVDAGAAAGASSRGRRTRPSTASPSTATPRPRTRCCWPRPAGRRCRRSPTPTTRGCAAFEAALTEVMRDLAHQVVRDGEGATKFVEVRVTGAASAADARKVGLVDRQLAAGQDRDRRRGPELGPDRDGGRQVGRGGRPRPAVDPLRRHPRRGERLGGARPTARPTGRPT